MTLKESILNSVPNYLLNAMIAYFLMRSKPAIFITADCISIDGSNTIVGSSVSSAFMLAVILTLITFTAHKRKLKKEPAADPDALSRFKMWPTGIGLALKNAIYAFGILVILGVLWQRGFGSIEVGLFAAANISGLIAGLAAAITQYSTLSAIEGNKTL